MDIIRTKFKKAVGTRDHIPFCPLRRITAGPVFTLGGKEADFSKLSTETTWNSEVKTLAS